MSMPFLFTPSEVIIGNQEYHRFDNHDRPLKIFLLGSTLIAAAGLALYVLEQFSGLDANLDPQMIPVAKHFAMPLSHM